MNLNEFKSQALAQGGARGNLFEVEGAIGNNSDGGLLKFMCKSASIPEQTVGEILVPWRGRQFKIPGDRTYTDWEITVISDAAFDLRAKFEAWNEKFQHSIDNVSDVGNITTELFQDWQIYWLQRDGTRGKGRKYNFVGCWPKTVGAIEVAFDNNDNLAEFPVTMTYQWWESPATDGNS